MTLENFDTLLAKYAKLLVRGGINVQAGHKVLISIDVDQAALARLLVEEAYAAGAADVKVKWTDDAVSRLRMAHTSQDILTDIKDFEIAESDYLVDAGYDRISVRSSDPDAMAGLDNKKISAVQNASGKAFHYQRQATQANKVSWLVAAASGEKWAAKVFPDLDSNEAQVDALWDAIFKAVHLYEDDPVAYWHEKDQRLEAQANLLNDAKYDALHYTAPGTDLVVGIPAGHIWSGAGSFDSKGNRFIANMPTEEVFGAPDANRIDGHVSSTKPLSYAGTTLEGMHFTFEKGKIVAANADKGEDILQALIATDEGSHSLGEIALVANSSPISQSNLTFYNTLFDENASCHLAIGSAYAFSLAGGEDMTEEELKAHGLNRSSVHVDFMIGSNKMHINGIKADGSEEAIMVDGEFVNL